MMDKWTTMNDISTPIVRSCSEGYDANKSQIGNDRLANWLQEDINPDLTSIPGIGPATAKKISEGDDGVTTTYQLMGRFLTLKTEKASSQEHCDALWYWLQGKGVNQYRSGIVQCIVEKMEIMLPNLYLSGDLKQE